MTCLYRSSLAIRFIPRRLSIDGRKLKAIMRLGVPAGMQGMLFSISNTLIQSAVNSFGSTMSRPVPPPAMSRVLQALP